MRSEDAYLLKDTHLKLGSKIHISDFVFAKRLFQKSAYASKFAYSISKNIFESLNPKSLKSSSKGELNFPQHVGYDKIILIGYAYYSELLTSRTEIILKNVFNIKNVNHIIIDNEKEINFNFYFKRIIPKWCILSEKTEPKKQLYCIITPISSTLTTPIKIENEFYRQLKHFCQYKCKFRGDHQCSVFTKLENEISRRSDLDIRSCFDFQILPYQTIILVGNKRINEFYQTDEDTKKNSLNYWEKILIKDSNNQDIKEIITRNRLKNEERVNQFHIYVKSHWEYIHNCHICFPDDLLDEKPLFEADKTLLTPDFIFDLPVIANNKIFSETYFVINDNSKIEFLSNPHISKEMVKYGHFRGTNKHFFYYIDYIKFYNGNETKIIRWALYLKEIYFKDKLNDNDRVLIITPDKSTSGRFAFTINRYVFEESCNIISFNPQKENISNFEKFFSQWLLEDSNRKTYIYYVDNLIAKGNTALAVHDVIKLLRQKQTKEKGKNQPGLAGVITMINRLDSYDFENIKRKIRNGYKSEFNDIFSYTILNFPVIQTNTDAESIESGCYLCNSVKNYKLIANECSLDNVKQYIIEKNLSKREIKSKFEEQITNENEIFGDTIRLLRLCISHKLNKSFSNPLIKEYFENENNVNDFDVFRIIFREYYLSDYSIEELTEYDLKCTLIKILAEPPFVFYRNIKKTVFKWILHETLKYLNIIENQLNECIYDFENLHYLRLLLKKASQLNMNFILSTECLMSLLKISEFEDKIKMYLDTNENEKLRRFLNFRLFVVASIKESIFNNEPRAIKLEINLNDQNILKAIGIHSSKRLHESLVLENTGVIRQAFKASEILFENSQLEYNIRNNPKVPNDEVLIELLNVIFKRGDNKIENVLRFIFCNNDNELDKIDENFNFGNAQAQSFIYSLSLYRYLRILSLLKPENKENISKDADYLLSQLCKILEVDTNNGGAFMILRFQDIGSDPFDNKNLNIVSQIGLSTKIFISKLEESDNTFTKMFFKGYKFDIVQREGSPQYYWTAIGAYKQDTNWQLQDHSHEENYNPFITYAEARHCGDLKRFYFIRISHWNINSLTNEKSSQLPQAVIVFFDNSNNEFHHKKTRFVLSLRNEISDFISNNYENDAFKSWVASEIRVGEYVKRYSKNTHGVYKRLNRLIGLAENNPGLFAVYSDIFVGQIHYSLLINEKISYETEIKNLNQVFDSTFQKLIKDYLIINSFNPSNIIFELEPFNNKEVFFNRFTKFVFFQLIMNAETYTIEGENKEAKVIIYAENEYIVVKNTKSKITKEKLELIRKILESTNIPLESISLYVINKFCQDMCKNPRDHSDLEINYIEPDTFLVKMPIILK